MKYTHGYNPEKEHKITGREMLISALSEITGKPEIDLRKISKDKLKSMWNELVKD